MLGSVHRISLAATLFCVRPVTADDLLYRYEGQMFPYDFSAGWLLFDPCVPPCTESLEGGNFLLQWPRASDLAFYTYIIAQPPDPPPPSLWVEWRFRSNHPLPHHSYDCDALFVVQFGSITDLVNIYGDAVISWSGAEFVWRLPNNEFRTYRFESPDGVNYWFAVDGLVFRTSYGKSNNGYHYLQFGGEGGCLDDQMPNMENAWDFVRFGTIGYGERIVASDPPAGFIDARQHAPLDRFTITYDSPNYVYIDDVTVEVMSSATKPLSHEATERTPLNPPSVRGKAGPALALGVPIVTATRRLDNGPPDVVEIVLDRPIPYNATTRFTFDDGVLAQALEYTFAPGDTNGDGRADLTDFATFQSCFGTQPLVGACLALDADANSAIDLSDFAAFERAFTSP